MNESFKDEKMLLGSLQMPDVDTGLKKHKSNENNSFKNAANPNMI